jgi:hypothetical protein
LVFWTTVEPQAVNGMDFAILDGERIQTLYAFVNVSKKA